MHTEPLGLDASSNELLLSAAKLLRKKCQLGDLSGTQSLYSIQQFQDTTIIQIGSTEFGPLYFSIPVQILPQELLKKILGVLFGCAKRLLPSQGIVTAYDGARQDINPKQFLRNHIVVRTLDGDLERFNANIGKLVNHPAIDPSNASIQFAVPQTEEEHQSIFQDDQSNWDAWQGVGEEWNVRVRSRNFSSEATTAASKSSVLSALASKKNVVIVVGHSEERVIHLPAPPPTGSTVTPSDLWEHREYISKNEPVVYLFCCESAKVDSIPSLAEMFIRCGALAVVAPQTKIDANKSGDLFEKLVVNAGSSYLALNRLLLAERETSFREMEVFF